MKETRRPIEGYSTITYGAFAFDGTLPISSGELNPFSFGNLRIQFYPNYYQSMYN